ncbi:hypothetical protein [Pedobacter sp. SL55]|uniref:hypothetical protein n=1 Tax=Pedobacter sp. SL55 TaxID=2995161 RepID=UPI00226DDE40|nr:hypothetical protein [Pedobacter sp. SL55]WAC39987.1 hypothetical protein OVA16_15570 [Pedobacter sp. SL55]
MVDLLIKILTFTINFISKDIFITFGFYSFLYIVFSFFLKKSSKAYEFDNISCQLISFSGLVYFSCFLLSIVFILHKGEEEKFSLINRMFGPYWFLFFLQPITYLIITQLLRFKKVKNSKIARLLLVPFFILTYEILTILTTSIHRDYLPSSWGISFSLPDMMIYFPTKLLFYLIVVVVFYIITEQLKKFRSKNKQNTNI